MVFKIREKNITYNERKVFIMLPEIFYNIAAILLIGTLASFLCYTIYVGYKAIKMTKDLTKH